MSTKRIIKKYQNRRLYDTEKSCYITLEEIQNLIMQNIDISIIDNHNQEDITSYILLQIISTQENSQPSLFTENVLKNIIRLHAHAKNLMISEFLEKSMSFFVQQTSTFNTNWQQIIEQTPINTVNKIADYNMKMWQNIFKPMFENETNTPANNKKEK